MAKDKKHRTTHVPDAEDGKVLVMCMTCRWRDEVNVEGLSYVDAMNAIFAARDAHEADPTAKAEGATDKQS